MRNTLRFNDEACWHDGGLRSLSAAVKVTNASMNRERDYTSTSDGMKKHYKPSTRLAVALCALGLSIGSSFAGNKPKLNHEMGTVQSIDAAKHELIIKDKANKTQSFTWNNATQFRESNKAVSAAQVKTGETVHLSYQESAGTPLLHHVTVVPATATVYTPKSK